MRGAMLGLVVAAALCAGCGDDGATGTATPAGTPGSSSSTPVAPTGPVASCVAGSLEPQVVRSGSVGSAPFVTIALRNTGDEACRVAGYPRLTASGVAADGRRGRLAVRVVHGPIYERADPGVHVVRLEPGESAVFHVGTATAYDVGGASIARLSVGVAGRPGAWVVPVHLDASHEQGRRIPVGVTALQAESDAQE